LSAARASWGRLASSALRAPGLHPAQPRRGERSHQRDRAAERQQRQPEPGERQAEPGGVVHEAVDDRQPSHSFGVIERRLDRHLADLEVSNLTDEDDVGSLTKHRSKNDRECQAYVVANLTLVHAREVIFHGIFRGDDFFIGSVQLLQRGVERRGFSGTGWSGHQENPVILIDHPFELTQQGAAQANLFQGEDVRSLVEQAQHYPLAKSGGQG